MQNEEKKNSKGFIANMKSELKKVVWPTGKQTAKSTAVTKGFVLLISVILIIIKHLSNIILWQTTDSHVNSSKIFSHDTKRYQDYSTNK